jgi:hypothetical protein
LIVPGAGGREHECDDWCPQRVPRGLQRFAVQLAFANFLLARSSVYLFLMTWLRKY